MASVKFSVPDDVKAAFDRTFAGQNRSAILTELMRRAVREHELQKRREQLFRRLTQARSHRPSASAEDIRSERITGRP